MSAYSFGKLFLLARNPILPLNYVSLRHVVGRIRHTSRPDLHFSDQLRSAHTPFTLTPEDEHFQTRDVGLQNFGDAGRPRSHLIQHPHPPDEGPEATQKGRPVGISCCDINRDTYNMVFFRHPSVLGSLLGRKQEKINIYLVWQATGQMLYGLQCRSFINWRWFVRE